MPPQRSDALTLRHFSLHLHLLQQHRSSPPPQFTRFSPPNIPLSPLFPSPPQSQQGDSGTMVGALQTQPSQCLSQSPQKENWYLPAQNWTFFDDWRGYYMMDLYVCSINLNIAYFQLCLICLPAMTSAFVFKVTLRNDTQVLFISQSSFFFNLFTIYQLQVLLLVTWLHRFTAIPREHQKFSRLIRIDCCILHLSNHAFKLISRYQYLPLHFTKLKLSLLQNNAVTPSPRHTQTFFNSNNPQQSWAHKGIIPPKA